MTYSKLGIDGALSEQADPRTGKTLPVFLPTLDPSGKEIPVYLYKSSRLQGTYIIGATGTGKSGLIENLILQDIEQDIGVCLLDPHGDLTTAVLARLPDREQDVILLDLADADFPFGLNLFACPQPNSPTEVQKIVDLVMHIFEKLFDVSRATPRIAQYLRNCTHTLIANPGYTMADLPLLLTDEACRRHLVAQVTDPKVRLFWKTYEAMKPPERMEHAESTLNKLDEFLSPLVMSIVGQATTTVNLFDVMNERKILLVKLSAQMEQVTSLIGSVIIALVLNAAYARADVPVSKRKQFHLYADEFQRFATEDFATLLTEARKFGIGTTIAHQARYQPGMTEGIRATTLQAANLVVFRVPTDAEELVKQFKATPQPGETEYKPVMKPKYKFEPLPPAWEPPEAEQQYEAAKKATQALREVVGEKARILFMLLSEEHRKGHGFTGVVREDASAALRFLWVLLDPLEALPIFHYDSQRASYLIDFHAKLWPQFNPPFRTLTFADFAPVPDPEKHLRHVDLLYINMQAKYHAYRLIKQPVLTPAEQNIRRLETTQPHYLAVVQQRLAQLLKLPGERQWNYLYWYIPEPADPPSFEAVYYPHMHGYWRSNEGPVEIKQWLAEQLRALQKEIDEAEARERKIKDTRYKTNRTKPVIVGYEQETSHIGYQRAGLPFITEPRTVYEQKPGAEETIANAQARVANELGRLPKATAKVKLSDGNGNAVEHTIQTYPPGKGIYGEALRRRIETIRQRNFHDGYLRARTDVEAEILNRQAQCGQQGFSPPQAPPAVRKAIPCASCGFSNPIGSKFCNQCGARL